MNHINELVAVDFVFSYLFDLENQVCKSNQYKKCSKGNGGNLGFCSFEEMHHQILKKLLYYFSYRAVAPKIIEGILEAYTYHPIWKLTGQHWNLQEPLP